MPGKTWGRPKRHVLRWDPHLVPREDDMEFRLTYAGALYGDGVIILPVPIAAK